MIMTSTFRTVLATGRVSSNTDHQRRRARPTGHGRSERDKSRCRPHPDTEKDRPSESTMVSLNQIMTMTGLLIIFLRLKRLHQSYSSTTSSYIRLNPDTEHIRIPSDKGSSVHEGHGRPHMSSILQLENLSPVRSGQHDSDDPVLSDHGSKYCK